MMRTEVVLLLLMMMMVAVEAMMKVMTVLPVKVEVMMMKGGRSHLVSALLEGRLSS